MFSVLALNPNSALPSIQFNLLGSPFVIGRPQSILGRLQCDPNNVLVTGSEWAKILLGENPHYPNFVPPGTFVRVDRGEWPIPALEEYRKGMDLNSKGLLILSEAAGIGDTVMFFPYLAELKRKYPKAKLFLSTSRLKHGLFHNQPWIDGLLPHPLHGSDVHDMHLLFAPKHHLNEESFGFVPSDPSPRLFVKKSKLKEAEVILNKIRSTFKKPIAFIHPYTSTDNRNIPDSMVVHLTRILKDFVCVACPHNEKIEDMNRLSRENNLPLVNLALPENNALSFLMAVISLSDVIISGDTSAVHLGGGLGKKVIMIQMRDYDLSGWPAGMKKLYPQCRLVKAFQLNEADVVSQTHILALEAVSGS